DPGAVGVIEPDVRVGRRARLVVHARRPAGAPVAAVRPGAVMAVPLGVRRKRGVHIGETRAIAAKSVVLPLAPGEQVRAAPRRIEATEELGAVRLTQLAAN